ncbi:MAG: hypothetical protein IJ086_00060 [Clostridium sp.]|nr:hypothetical protein [Clostridium sp.]
MVKDKTLQKTNNYKKDEFYILSILNILNLFSDKREYKNKYTYFNCSRGVNA